MARATQSRVRITQADLHILVTKTDKEIADHADSRHLCGSEKRPMARVPKSSVRITQADLYCRFDSQGHVAHRRRGAE